jgi:predicted chitinase
MQEGVRLAQCTNPRRIAMFYAQTGTESANFGATEEYASGAEYEGRVDLGNTQPGDGVRFKGRTYIQITGRHNYGQFSQWAFDNGLVPTPTYFVDNPTELGDVKWAGIGAAWYWTVARPTINSYCDQGDVVTVGHEDTPGQ